MKPPRKHPTKRTSTLFLQLVILLIGLGTFALMLWMPHLEGRNANATLFQIYFNDPFLAYVYAASIAFFIALYQAFKLLGHIARNQVFSLCSVQALRTIKYCAMSLVAFIAGAEVYLFTVQRSRDDIAGGVMMGLVMLCIAIVVATAAAVFERILQRAVAIKSENDLTV